MEQQHPSASRLELSEEDLEKVSGGATLVGVLVATRSGAEPVSGNTYYLGSANGGVWKTTNG
jgi:hypothetical protein